VTDGREGRLVHELDTQIHRSDQRGVGLARLQAAAGQLERAQADSSSAEMARLGPPRSSCWLKRLATMFGIAPMTPAAPSSGTKPSRA
jgi:hypothetical protein